MRLVLLALVLLACSSPPKPTPPPPAPVAIDAAPVIAPDALVLDAAPVVVDAAPVVDAVATLIEDGGSCYTASQCASGICEGQGCSDLIAGTCAPKQRSCTKDLRSYCGCDGKTFRTSGSCPGRRYHAKGQCPTAAKGRPAGALCLEASQCASGTCEGKGCTDDQPGTCAANPRPCTMDVQRYCTCDGKIVTGSGTCPGVRYRQRGGCE